MSRKTLKAVLSWEELQGWVTTVDKQPQTHDITKIIHVVFVLMPDQDINTFENSYCVKHKLFSIILNNNKDLMYF